MKTVENSYALASSVRDLNCRGIHLRWSFSLSLFDQRGSSAESVCWVDRKRRSCFCDGLCRRGPTIAESSAKRFAHTANAPVSRRRNWPSGLSCTTISSGKLSVGTWRFHWARCSKSQKPWAFAGATFSETSDFYLGRKRGWLSDC